MALIEWKIEKPIDYFKVSTRGLTLTKDGIKAADAVLAGFSKAKQVKLYFDDASPKIVAVPVEKAADATAPVKINDAGKLTISVVGLISYVGLPIKLISAGDQTITLNEEVKGVEFPIKVASESASSAASSSTVKVKVEKAEKEYGPDADKKFYIYIPTGEPLLDAAGNKIPKKSGVGAESKLVKDSIAAAIAKIKGA